MTCPKPHDRPMELNQRLARAEARCELTPREVEVLRLVVLGRSYKEIAEELGCEECTIEAHVTHLRRKCGSDGKALSRSELIAWFWTMP